MLSHLRYIIRRGIVPLLLALLLLPSWLGGGAFAASVRQVLVDSLRLSDTILGDSLAITDSLVSSLDPADSLQQLMDSVLNDANLASVTDSIAQDSTKKKKEGGGLTAVVNYKAKDSVVFTMGNLAWLYGQSQITYADIQLDAERIQLSLDSSLVHANGVPDSLGKLQGKPVFKDNSGEYETRTMSYNFKTAKGYICDVVTQQGDGYVTGGVTKKMPDSDIFLADGKYTTCDQVECPHFYIQLTKARVRPKKNIVTGPAYLVVADVPLPVAIPFGYFPFTKSYSSGIIMPSYGTDQQRGLYLRDGGYYFAINDYMDLSLKGEIYTKGSWGISAESRYSVRYKYKGNFSFSYLVSKTGDKGLQDYQEQNNMRVIWSHSQDSRFNPNLTLSASVNYTTSGYERSNTRSLYSNEMTQSTKSSTINATYKIPNSLWNISASTSISQRTTDSTLVVTLPDLSLSMSRWNPFKRKKAAGAERWYEKISLTYQGRFSNNITTKQDQFFEKSLVKDWDNGMQHSIPVSATFTALKYINITPSFSFTDRTYSHKTKQYYDPAMRNSDGSLGGVAKDTVYGFYNSYNFNSSISANTKLYGFYTPMWKNSKLVAVRHLLTPTISFNYTPDFSDHKYGSWGSYYVPDSTSVTGMKEVKYSYFQGYKYGTTSQGRSGSINFSVANNIEAKIRSDKDSTGYKKISIIDNLTTNISYNLVADSMKWSTTLPVTATFKFSKNSTMNLQATFDNYMYDQDGRYYDKTRWSAGQLPRLMSTGYSWSYQLNNEKLAKLFGRGSDSGDDDEDDDSDLDFDEDGYVDEEIDPTSLEGMQRNQAKKKRKKEKKQATGKYDDDGFLIWKLPWSLNFSYSMRYAYLTGKDHFNHDTKGEYDRGIIHSATLSGTFQPTEAWNFSFNASYDFNLGKVTFMNINCSRDMHCWALTASLNPMGQYASFNVNIAVKSTMLSDLKYEKTSVSRSNKIDWYND